MLLLLAAAAAAAAALPSPAIPAQPELTDAIAARDAELFDLLFQKCDPERMRTLVVDDLEFYHDKAGFNARSGQEFVAGYAKDCEARNKPGAWRSRRELVRSSLHVDPVPGWGAIQAGEHLFYERQADGPEMLAGRARFTQLWVLAPDGWRLSRVLSYAHGPAD